MRQNINLDSKFYGPEPIWNREFKDQIEKDCAYLKALNWYNYMGASDATKKAWVIEYLKKNNYDKTYISNVSKCSNMDERFNLSTHCRMLNLGCTVIPDKIKEKMKRILDAMSESQKGKEVKIDEETTEDNSPSIQDKINSKISDIIGDLEYQSDQKLLPKKPKAATTLNLMNKASAIMSNNGVSTSLVEEQKPKSLKDFFHSKNVKANQCSKIIDWFIEKKNTIQNEIKEYPESYGPNINDVVSFYDEIINTCSEYNKQIKSVIKIRKRKAKSPIDLVKKLKYKQEDTTLQIKSVLPTKIIGAEKVLLFNTKYNKATLLECSNSGGLTVKGSTILNFDDKKSFTKKIRKPQKFIKDIDTKGIRGVKSALESIKSKQYEAKGRINEDVIILGVY